ncbi:uncharacterized protein [Aegilops tauschii subsp. strangulata]|uniref:uncharacterized protein n=1 Tax=Aegilops tauschii subsp. strangulata TaxID=200361 RepID=UPI003CC8A39A
MAAPRALVLAVLLATAVVNAEAASVVVGLAKCADCTRKNIKAQEAFKGLQVAIKCKNSHGDYESKAVGALDSTHIFSPGCTARTKGLCEPGLKAHFLPVTGAFRVPLAAGLHGNDCITQLHITASNAPCRGQEPSKIVPVSEGTTFGIVAGDNTVTPYEASPECASMTLCGPIKKHIIEHFHHKKPVPPKPEAKPQPHPNYGPVPLVENRALVRPEKSINPGCIMNRD